MELTSLPGIPASSGISLLAKSAVAVACPADLLENTLASIVVPAGSMGPNGRIIITSEWAFTNNANNKTMRVKFGANTFRQAVMTTQGNIRDVTDLGNVNATNVQKGTSVLMIGGSTLNYLPGTAGGNNTAAAVTIALTGQKDVAGDSLTLESYTVQLMYGA